MGSGEGDAADLARRLLAQSRTLDGFTRCRAAAGCDVMVHLSGNDLCLAHGGWPNVPEYVTRADDGAIVKHRNVSINLGGECE